MHASTKPTGTEVGDAETARLIATPLPTGNFPILLPSPLGRIVSNETIALSLPGRDEVVGGF
jgi:hypothetical protein